MVGVLAGVGATLFYLLFQIVVRYSMGELAGYLPPLAVGEPVIFDAETPSLRPWMVVAVSTVAMIYLLGRINVHINVSHFGQKPCSRFNVRFFQHRVSPVIAVSLRNV